MNYVIDASVILKWFLDEPDSASALLFRQRHESDVIALACPDIALYEFGNVLRYKPDVTEHAIQQAISELLNLELEIFPPTESLLHSAAQLSRRQDLTFYDATYVALALELDAPLVTADLKLLRKAQGVVNIQPLIHVR